MIIRPGPTDKVYSVAKIAIVVESLAAEGIASADALAGVNLSPTQLHSAATRVSLNQVIRCYRNAARLSADPYFAYHTGLRFHVSTYGMYGFAILSSMDFRQAVEFAEQYQQLATPTADIAFKEKGDYAEWTINPVPLSTVDPILYRFIVELHFGIGVSLHREVMAPSFIPRELRATYDSASDRQTAATAYGCPVFFGQAENAIVFDRKWLDGPAEFGNELAHLQVVKLCDQLMKEMQLRIGLAGSVRELLLVNLAQPMSFDALARRLKIPTRTLKRKLREEGTSYRKIIDELRSQLAIKYLRDTELTVEDIASCLGFSDAAGFRHAFRRWTKETPGKFRRKSKVSHSSFPEMHSIGARPSRGRRIRV